MKAKRVIKIDKEEEYLKCDICGDEIITRNKEIEHKIIIKGTGLCFVKYVQGVDEFDACNNCALKVKEFITRIC